MNFHPIENSSDTAQLYVPILMDMYKPKKVLDLGCNVGWWLHWFMKSGVKDIMGIDGDNMLQGLKIPKNNYIVADLTKPLYLYKKFDLLICIEVAEHLDEKYADILIKNIVMHSNTVFWSAASPNQGGYHHVNEQPMEYWIKKFEKHGYKARILCDVLPVAPHDYYRKNAIEFIKK